MPSDVEDAAQPDREQTNDQPDEHPDDQEQEPEELKHVFDDDVDMPLADADDDDHAAGAEHEKPAAEPEGDDEPSSHERPPERDDSDDEPNPAVASPAPSSQPSSSAKPGADDDDDGDLYTKLSTAPASVPGLVTEWLRYVARNGPAAVAELFSLLVRLARPATAAPTEMITSAMVIRNEPHAAVAELAHVLRADEPGTIPAVAKDPASRRLRRAFEDFWRRLPAESGHAIVFDTDCFDTLISWLEALAGAKSRPLRMAACFAAYRLADGLIDFGTKLRKELASMRKQLASEKRKCGVDQVQARGTGRSRTVTKVLSQKGKDLLKKVDEWGANNSYLIDLSGRIFSEIFILKYRDVSPDIRALSVTSLGAWILAYPDHYLDDTHNKYIGWLLSDKEANVRRSSLAVLLRLLQKKDFFSRIQIFLGSFSGRLMEMARDRDDAVAVEAIRVLAILAQHQALDHEGCERICDMAAEEPVKEIRRAAGEFLVNFIFSEQDKEDASAGKESSRGKRVPGKRKKQSRKKISTGYLEDVPPLRRSCEVLLELLFAVGKKGVKHGAAPDLVVDAVWDHVPALRSWDAFITLLDDDRPFPELEKRNSQDSDSNEPDELAMEKEKLSEEDKAVLCEMLLASTREASGHGDGARKANILRQFEGPDSPGTALSNQILPELSQLLVQFQGDTRALAALVKLPVHFQMACFEQDGHERHFEAVLMKLIDITSRHTRSPDLVKSCADTFKALLSDENPLQKVTSSSLRIGCSAAAKELSLQVRADLEKADPSAVAAAALRVRSLCELIEPSTVVYEPVVKLLEYQLDCTASSDLSDDVTTDAMRIGCATIVWSLLKIKSRIETSSIEAEGPARLAEDDVADLKSKGSKIIDLMSSFCSSVLFPVTVRIVALQSLLTTLIMTRGVEKHVHKVTTPITSCLEDQGESEPKESRVLDLLGSLPKVKQLTNAVRSCVLALLENELRVREGQRGGKRLKRAELSDEVLRDCFASLVQSSSLSVLAGNIAYLPILGLLLRRRRPSGKDQSQSEWTAYQLCQQYCQRRAHSESLCKDEVKALRDAADIANADSSYQVVRELADTVVSTRGLGDPGRADARDILEKLTEKVLNARANVQGVCKWLGILSAAGFALVTHLHVNDAEDVLSVAEEIVVMVGEEESLRDRPEASLFDTFHTALKAVSSSEAPVLPPRLRLHAENGRGVTRRRRKAMKDPAAHFSSSAADGKNVRRSGRERNRVDYARLVGLGSAETDEEDETSEDSVDQEEKDREEASGEAPQASSAADVARNLMKFSSSPRIPAVRRTRTPPKMPAGRSAVAGDYPAKDSGNLDSPATDEDEEEDQVLRVRKGFVRGSRGTRRESRRQAVENRGGKTLQRGIERQDVNRSSQDAGNDTLGVGLASAAWQSGKGSSGKGSSQEKMNHGHGSDGSPEKPVGGQPSDEFSSEERPGNGADFDETEEADGSPIRVTRNAKGGRTSKQKRGAPVRRSPRKRQVPKTQASNGISSQGESPAKPKKRPLSESPSPSQEANPRPRRNGKRSAQRTAYPLRGKENVKELQPDGPVKEASEVPRIRRKRQRKW